MFVSYFILCFHYLISFYWDIGLVLVFNHKIQPTKGGVSLECDLVYILVESRTFHVISFLVSAIVEYLLNFLFLLGSRHQPVDLFGHASISFLSLGFENQFWSFFLSFNNSLVYETEGNSLTMTSVCTEYLKFENKDCLLQWPTL